MAEHKFTAKKHLDRTRDEFELNTNSIDLKRLLRLGMWKFRKHMWLAQLRNISLDHGMKNERSV